MLEDPAIMVRLAVIAFFLGIGILITAIGTWQGKRLFRNVLVVQVVLLSLVNSAFLLLYFLMWMTFSSRVSEMITSVQISVVTNIARSLIVGAVFVVYFLRQRDFFQTGQDSQPDGFLTSLAAVPEGRNYFLLAGSLVVFLHWFLVFPAGELARLNIYLMMPETLVNSTLTSLFYPQTLEAYLSLGPTIIESIVAPILDALFWFLLGVGLAYKIKPLKRVLAVCLGIKIVFLLLGLLMVTLN